jgi:hypothetical protein
MPTLFSLSFSTIFRSLSVLALWLCISALQATELNDTGVTFCGDETTKTAQCLTVSSDGGTYPRQDARYGRDAKAAARKLEKAGSGSAGFDYTKIANNGTLLPVSAELGTGGTDWACTRDNVTGLVWEVKSTSGLRSQSHTYSWYNSNTATNEGFAGNSSLGTCYKPGRCDTEKFTADVNTAKLCSFNDWRMPKLSELVSIVHYGRTNPAIDTDYFPNTPIDNFWSGSLVDYPGNSYGGTGVVLFDFGRVGTGSGRGNKFKVRLVRGQL